MDSPEVIDIPHFVDDRGMVYGVDNLDELGIKRTYVITNWEKGRIRAWHGHKKADTYMHVIKGAAKIAALKMKERDGEDWSEIDPVILTGTLSDRKPQLFKIPAGWYNGSMTFQEGTIILVYSTLTLDEVKLDNFRIEVDLTSSLQDMWQVKNR